MQSEHTNTHTHSQSLDEATHMRSLTGAHRTIRQNTRMHTRVLSCSADRLIGIALGVQYDVPGNGSFCNTRVHTHVHTCTHTRSRTRIRTRTVLLALTESRRCASELRHSHTHASACTCACGESITTPGTWPGSVCARERLEQYIDYVCIFSSVCVGSEHQREIADNLVALSELFVHVSSKIFVFFYSFYIKMIVFVFEINIFYTE